MRRAGERGPGRGGGFVAGFRRLLDNPDHPLGWSLKLFRFLGIEVRIHLVTIVVFAGFILSSLLPDSIGPWFMTMMMGSLFVLVLIHEYGHCLAARWVGGEADRIVMLPIGGLALANPPQRWKAHLITAAGGPAVHVVIFPITAGLLALTGEADAIVFNPFAPGALLADVGQGLSTGGAYAAKGLWIVHYVNLLLFAFNVLLVMFPFDGGRIVQALLWRKMGFVKSMSVAVHAGLVVGVLLFVFAIALNKPVLMAIALFGGLSCWAERSRLRAVDEITGFVPGVGGDGPGGAAGLGVGSWSGLAAEDEDEGPSRRERKEAEQRERDQQELDRLLEKISRQGMDALTAAERRTLARVTKQKQRE